MTRRTLLLSLPMVAAASRALAQAGGPALTVRALNHMTVTVSDRQRSLAFYQGLFGWPVQHNQGTSTGIRIGAGPQYISLSQGGPNARPSINHFCMTVDGFDVDRIMRALEQHAVSTTAPAGAGAMKAWVRLRGADAGGAKEGTPELYVNDPDGNRFQLQDARYCGGSGLLGEVCPSLPTGKGRLVVRDYSSFTLTAANRTRSKDFYQAVFGLPLKSEQDGVAQLGVGAGSQRLLIDGDKGVTPRISQACLVMDDFDPGTIQKALAEFGVKPVADPGATPAAPFVSYTRRRTGSGAEARVPDLLFTDPDGILIQLRGASA